MNNTGLIYLQLEDYEKAATYFEKAFIFIEFISNINDIIEYYYNLALAYLKNKNKN